MAAVGSGAYLVHYKRHRFAETAEAKMAKTILSVPAVPERVRL